MYQLSQESAAAVKHLLRGKHTTVLADWDAYDRIEAIRKESGCTVHAAALRLAKEDAEGRRKLHEEILADAARTLRKAHQRHRQRWGLLSR